MSVLTPTGSEAVESGCAVVERNGRADGSGAILKGNRSRGRCASAGRRNRGRKRNGLPCGCAGWRCRQGNRLAYAGLLIFVHSDGVV